MRRRSRGLTGILSKAAFGLPIAVAMIVALSAAASAAFDPYVKGSIGYDFSYVQCGSAAPTAKFGVVGVNAGYPFTYYNGCLGAEFATAAKTGNAAVYVNTGYDPSYTAIDGRHTTQDCANQSQAVTGTKAQRAAWAVGCSEGQRDTAYASSQSVASPTAWWLDVETANSWSSTDLTLNTYTIQGLVATLRQSVTVPIGVYSTSLQWGVITGGYQAQVDADWVATGQRTLKRAKRFCGSTGFTGASIWLIQYVGSIDHDYVC
jgi:hypothetical protein